MKTIELVNVKEPIEVNTKEGMKIVEVDIKTTDLLKNSINNPAKGGYSVSEMRQRIKLLDIIDKAEKEDLSSIELEDADFQALSNMVKDTKWSVLSKNIIKFSEQFE